jgi:outer membrane protein assembly factor BamB
VLGAITVVLLAPDTNPAVGVGQRVPLLFTASLFLVVAGAASAAASFQQSAPRVNRGQLLARFAVPVVIVVAMFLVVAPLWRSYTLATNEHLDGPRGPADASARSELTGEVAWSSESDGYNSDGLRGAVSTPYGIATARKIATIDMLDPATGELRWRYTRADSTSLPHLYVTGGGRLLLASFDDLGYLLLDADTGKRKAAWSDGTRDHDIQNTDPLLTGEMVSKGSDKLRGVDTDGHARWTFEPGRCTSISAVATTDTAFVSLGHSCGDTPDELTALDLHSGKKLWSRAGDWSGGPVVAGGLVVGLQSDRELIGVEARTGDVKWRWQLPAALACTTRLEQAGDKVVLFNCPAGTDKTRTTFTVINGADGTVDWQRTAPIDWSAKPAVTADARVVALVDLFGTCKVGVVEESGYRQAVVPKEVRCTQGVRAVGNLVLARGKDSLIALR